MLIGGKNERFRINSGVRQGSIMSNWLFNVYMSTVMKEMMIGMGRRGMRFLGGGERVEITWPLVCR